MEAYCMKCKTKREIKDPVAQFNAKGSPVTVGVCPVCGTKLYRMGRTPAHEGLVAPARPEKVEKLRLRALAPRSRSATSVSISSSSIAALGAASSRRVRSSE